MKKIISLMVIAALTLPIYACGSKKADVTPEENNALSSQTMQNGEEESNNEIIRTEQGTDSEDTTPCCNNSRSLKATSFLNTLYLYFVIHTK